MPRRGIDLTVQQWTLAKTSAASRGQTLSQYFADLVTGGPPVKPMTNIDQLTKPGSYVPTEPFEPFDPKDTSEFRGATRQTFGQSRPAPKPARKK